MTCMYMSDLNFPWAERMLRVFFVTNEIMKHDPRLESSGLDVIESPPVYAISLPGISCISLLRRLINRGGSSSLSVGQRLCVVGGRGFCRFRSCELAVTRGA